MLTYQLALGNGVSPTAASVSGAMEHRDGGDAPHPQPATFFVGTEIGPTVARLGQVERFMTGTPAAERTVDTKVFAMLICSQLAASTHSHVLTGLRHQKRC